MPNCKIDLSDFNRHFGSNGRKNQEIKDGVNAGLKKIAPEMEEMYRIYQQRYVYIRPEGQYRRTYKFKESTKSEVNGTKLFVYSNPDDLESNADSKPYSYHILHGYHHWGREDYTPPRDWVDPMALELKIHLEQDGNMLQTIKNEIQKRV